MSEDARSPSANPYNDWLSSVSNDWRKLENTPGLIKDEALCKAALALDGDALQFVPEALKTKELCMLAAEHRTELQFIPNGVLNQELIFAVVKNNPSQIRKVPINMCTASVLAEYVKSGSAYDLYELCEKSGNPMEKVALILVASGLDDLDALPGYAMTPPVYAMAEQLYSGDTVRHQWQATRTRHKPNYLESKLSREMLKQLQTDPESYRRYHVHLFFKAWAVFWDNEFLKRMINKGDSRIITCISKELLNEEVCFAAVSKSGLCLRYVPDSLRTLPVCLQAVQNDGSAIAFTPKRLRDQIRGARL